ncbi:hypothetical protein ACLOJK_000724, partial [Asimina triloba]
AYDAVREREGKSREPGCYPDPDPDPDPAPPLRSPAVVVVVASSSLSPSGTFPLDPHLFLDLVLSPAAPSRSRFVSLPVSVPLYPLSLPSRAPLLLDLPPKPHRLSHPPLHPKAHRLLRPQTPHQQLRHPRLRLRLLHHWVRWDASPYRDLIRHAIEAFEEENAAKEEVSFRNPPVWRSAGGSVGMAECRRQRRRRAPLPLDLPPLLSFSGGLVSLSVSLSIRPSHPLPLERYENNGL